MFAITKLLGNRQMSQLSMFDYITGITIGSIGAEMATAGKNFAGPLIAATIFGLAAFVISISTKKALWLRSLFNGRPILLMHQGQLFEQNFVLAKLDIHEFLTQCRAAGYFDISDLHTAILESNGHISFLPVAAMRPATPEDLGLTPKQAQPLHNLIIDGKLQTETLTRAGYNETWLNAKLHAAGISEIKNIFLATCTTDGEVAIYKKSAQKKEKKLP